jgi:hypothetical protein
MFLSQPDRLALSCVCFVILAAQPSAAQTGQGVEAGGRLATDDVALSAGGVLRGRVIDPEGNGLADVGVSIWQRNTCVAHRTTVRDGRFGVRGLQGGVYTFVTAANARVYRLWSEGTAPPKVSREVWIVAGDLVRGQCGGTCGGNACGGACCANGCLTPVRGHYDGALMRTLAKPWVIAGLTAAAIAIPIAVDDDDAS